VIIDPDRLAVLSSDVEDRADSGQQGMHSPGEPGQGIDGLPAIYELDLSKKPAAVIERVGNWREYTDAVGAEFGSAYFVVTTHAVVDTAATIPAYLAIGITLAALAWRRRLRPRGELLLVGGALAATAFAVFAAAPTVERVLFAGDFRAWLLASAGVTYDQRNAVVVGFALGFAVIPIIFTLAEDAFSNVPPSLVSASLALGATRWQAARTVAIPAASPGLFAAVMTGLGRAVGETMIVLMATGNTPIMSLSPFDGMRTMAASIAVELPEAPFGDTLYRVLILTALMLFAMTFVINSAAVLVAARLRKRFGRLAA